MITLTEPPLGLTDLMVRIGGLAWVSGQLFEIEGRWAETFTSPEAVVHLATHSRHHGWHATLWSEALPDSPALDAHAAVGSPGIGWERAVDVARGMENASDTARLAILYRGLLPRAISLLAHFQDALGGPGDAHLSRVAGLVLPDIVRDTHCGHQLLEATLCDQDTIETACFVTKALDQAFRN